MKRLSLRFIIPLVAVALLLVWWLRPHYSNEDKARYAAVFCSVNHADASTGLSQMQQVIEGGNSDYALHKTTFSPSLAKAVIRRWEQLSGEEKQRARDPAACSALLGAAMRR